MRINVNKFVCMRFELRFSIQCANCIIDSGEELNGVEECRYLGVYLVSARQFKCSWHNAKCAFYRAFNAIFGRLGRSAASEVILYLVRSKCIAALLYGLDACPVNAIDFKSLQHPITNFLMKMFATKSAEVVIECQEAFGFQLIRNQINCRNIKFLNRYVTSPSGMCTIACNQCAINEIQYFIAERTNI